MAEELGMNFFYCCVSIVGCICLQITSHSARQGCPDAKIPSNAADKHSIHLLNLKAAPNGFSMAQHISKCIATWPFLQKRGLGQLMTHPDIIHRLDCLVSQHSILASN